MREVVQIPPALRSLELPFPPKVYSYLSGIYESQHQGSGLEFAELREYVAGDEVRSIDWKASARGQKTYVKTYVDLRNQDVIFAMDGSSSMVVTSDETSALYSAGTLVGIMLRLALSRGDKVGFLTTQNGVIMRSPVVGQRLRALLWYEKIYEHIQNGVQQSTDWPVFLEQIRLSVHRRSLIIIISDDFSLDKKSAQSYRVLRAMGHRVWCMKVCGSTLDDNLAAQNFDVIDVETGELADWSVLDTRLQNEFVGEDARLLEIVSRELKLLGVEFGVLKNRSEVVPTLVRILMEYKKKRGRS